jgi:hypothetical protein
MHYKDDPGCGLMCELVAGVDALLCLAVWATQPNLQHKEALAGAVVRAAIFQHRAKPGVPFAVREGAPPRRGVTRGGERVWHVARVPIAYTRHSLCAVPVAAIAR